MIDYEKKYNELLELIQEEIEVAWVQEYAGADYQCKFCENYNNHSEDCLVSKIKKIINNQ